MDAVAREDQDGVAVALRAAAEGEVVAAASDPISSFHTLSLAFRTAIEYCSHC